MEEYSQPQPGSYSFPHPEVWTLALRLKQDGFDYAIYSRMEDNSLITGEVAFSGTDDSYVKELEEAVYAHEFLLTPFGKVTVVVDSDRFVIVPEAIASDTENDLTPHYRYLYGDDNRRLRFDKLQGCSLVYGINSDVDSFLRRTFYNPPVVHALTPLTRYFSRKGSYGGRRKMYAYLHDGVVAIVALDDSRLLAANTYSIATADDALYYIAAAWQATAMSDHGDELHLIGDKTIKQQLLPRLRHRLRNVMQVIFPAELLRLGKDAMSAPFDLIILPLCE